MNVLIELRKSRAWSQAELARRAHMHPSTISLAEGGRLKLSAIQRRRLARALGVDAELLTQELPEDRRA